MLAYVAKLACFQPVASSLRSNFPKLVFGHLHLLAVLVEASFRQDQKLPQIPQEGNIYTLHEPP